MDFLKKRNVPHYEFLVASYGEDKIVTSTGEELVIENDLNPLGYEINIKHNETDELQAKLYVPRSLPKYKLELDAISPITEITFVKSGDKRDPELKKLIELHDGGLKGFLVTIAVWTVIALVVYLLITIL